MKKALLSCFILVPLVLALSACQLFGLKSGENSDLFKLSKSTTPWVAGVTGVRSLGAPGTSKAFTQGGPTFRLYQVFRAYSYPADEGIIDTGNIYKLIYEASSILDGDKSRAEPITPTPLQSPFNFGTGPIEYDHLYNQAEGMVEENGNTYYKTLAYKEDGTTTHAVFGYTVEEPVTGGIKTQRQIFLTSFDTLGKDLTLDFATFDDKPITDTNDFGRRFYVEGNADTHEFFCHLATGRTSVTSLVGKGVSDGTGYYVLCLPGSVRADDKYYKLPAGATLEDFESLDEAGSALTAFTVIVDPEGYAADINTYLETPAYTIRSGIPTSLEAFTNGGHVVLP